MRVKAPTRTTVASAITAFGVLPIISQAYVGLNGPHVWRHLDAYSQILGMLGQRGLEPLSAFTGAAVMYDFPL